MSCVEESNVENNSIVELKKKARGRPKMSDEEKKKKKEQIKEYQKEYKQTHKEDIKKYNAGRYSEEILIKNKISNKINYQIINLIKELYLSSLLIVKDDDKQEILVNLLKQKYKTL